MSRHKLDARNLLCPMPVIRTQNRIKTLLKGDILEVTCTDPGAKNDLPSWCRINGHQVNSIETQDNIQGDLKVNEIIIKIEVGGE